MGPLVVFRPCAMLLFAPVLVLQKRVFSVPVVAGWSCKRFFGLGPFVRATQTLLAGVTGVLSLYSTTILWSYFWGVLQFCSYLSCGILYMSGLGLWCVWGEV